MQSLKKMRLFALAAFATLSCLAEPSKSPMEWAPVQTNEIARWKAENKAPAGVVVDKAARTVRFLAEATGLGAGETVEFFAIGPLSDRAYESLFVTVASPDALAKAIESVGVPRGFPVDPLKARFWPQGEKVSLSVKAWGADAASRPSGGLSTFLKDVRANEDGKVLEAPLAYAGGTRDASGSPIAATNIPCAVFSLYNHAQSLLQLDGLFDQSGVYGRFVAPAKFKAGSLFEIVAAWDGKRVVKDRELKLTATNAGEVMTTLKDEAKAFDVHARLAFDASVTIAHAAAVAQAFALLDGQGVKMNGRSDGQFFFRAFLPDPKWRDRASRIFQPFEVHVAADGTKSFVFVEEDWSGEALDPVLKPKTTPFKDWQELPGLIAKTGEEGAKITVMFVYAPKTSRVADLAPVVKAVEPRVNTFYVFAED